MTAPDLTTYQAVHTALREAASRLAAAATDLRPADWGRVRAFAVYWHGYAGEVVAHHTIEDDIFFPALLERCPDVARHVERTDADHHHLDELMAATTAAVRTLERGMAAPELADLLGQLAVHMDEHLGFEDDDLLPRFARHFDAAEYGELEVKAQKHLGLGKQAAFTVPFVMTWADPEVADRLLAGAPGAFRLLHRLTRGRHARLTAKALGPMAARRPATAVLQAA